MSNYPPGMPGPWSAWYELCCPNEHRWERKGTNELGGLFFDDDGVCPVCGEDGVAEGPVDPPEPDYDAMRERELENRWE